MKTGIFISIEGPDGAGKTSVLQELLPRLQAAAKVTVMSTREPGGIPISEKIRQIILDPGNSEMDKRTEALLYAAARRQHLVQKILPALADGQLVVCDRFVDSSLAYQGAGRRIGIEAVAEINAFAIEDKYPDLTLYLDVDSDTGLERIRKGRKSHELDRLDVESPEFHQRVRHAYLQILADNPDRIIRVDARENIADVVETCYSIIKEKYPDLFN
ncbi:dTMP kinase [Vagococcus acidifermentans]|uniref:Thymidylate kinase n=1 Tax=Vagococcus acidifermentans TaxID=564710 RepID=A0A430B0L8_9ENTE|nr:dTMP kinase [Vagococcus acidifermentans]RSU13868.1 dTMP kinase [Vagococcus acidifermentans]